MTILERILETKRQEVMAASKKRPLGELLDQIKQVGSPRDFHAAVTVASPHGVQLIAETKSVSPSAGLLVHDYDPARIARRYVEHGAAAVSVLTDHTYFGGHLGHIEQVKAVVSVPVLRKDFIIDTYQVYESRAAGADAVLLIAEVLPTELTLEFASIAMKLDLAVLVEVHTEENLSALLESPGLPWRERCLLGINNRDLRTQQTDLGQTSRIAQRLPDGLPFVAESGMASRDDVLQAHRAGACAILVGESLLRASDVGAKIDALLGKKGA